jgi:hypothetical protein
MKREKWLSKQAAEITKRSGSVNAKGDTARLVSFLYELMRDYITPGDIEKIVRNSTGPKSGKVKFCNGYLANYSKDIANRLFKQKKN